jgi:hypothetical protein
MDLTAVEPIFYTICPILSFFPKCVFRAKFHIKQKLGEIKIDSFKCHRDSFNSFEDSYGETHSFHSLLIENDVGFIISPIIFFI